MKREEYKTFTYIFLFPFILKDQKIFHEELQYTYSRIYDIN